MSPGLFGPVYHEELNAPIRRNKEEPKARPLRVGDTEKPEPDREYSGGLGGRSDPSTRGPWRRWELRCGARQLRFSPCSGPGLVPSPLQACFLIYKMGIVIKPTTWGRSEDSLGCQIETQKLENFSKQNK